MLIDDESHILQAEVKYVNSPKTESGLCTLLKRHSSDLISISGAGTGLGGGRVPIQGSRVVFMERMLETNFHPGFESQVHVNIDNRHLTYQLDKLNNKAIFPAGATLRTIDDILSSEGYMLPPNPTERSAQIGASTGSSGGRSFSFGTMRDYIWSLRVVLANGDRLQLERGQQKQKADGLAFSIMSEQGNTYSGTLPSYKMPTQINPNTGKKEFIKNAAGLYAYPGMDLIDLFIGSEGILGVITEVGVKLEKRKNTELGLVVFDNYESAFSFYDEIKQMVDSDAIGQAGNSPPGIYTLDMFYEGALHRSSTLDIPLEAKAGFVYELNMDEEFAGEFLYNTAEKYGMIASIHNDNDVKKFRHDVPSHYNEKIGRLRYLLPGIHKVATDGAVPEHARLQMHNNFLTAISYLSSLGIECVPFGHQPEHIHFNIDYIKDSDLSLIADERVQVHVMNKFHQSKKTAFWLLNETVKLGGTVSGEHGVQKKSYQAMGKHYSILRKMYGDQGTFEILRVKKAFKAEQLNLGNMGVPYSRP